MEAGGMASQFTHGYYNRENLGTTTRPLNSTLRDDIAEEQFHSLKIEASDGVNTIIRQLIIGGGQDAASKGQQRGYNAQHENGGIYLKGLCVEF